MARREGPFRPDAVGALLFCVATATFLYALSSGGHRFAWASWPMFALLAGALVGFVFLVRWERRHHDPVIPIHFLKVPAIARSDAVVMCFGGALFSVILYMPLYLQLGRGMGIGASGALLLPITLAQATSAAIVGRLVTHTGRVNIFPKIGLTLATVAFLGLAASVASASTATIMALTVLVGVGLGMVMPPTQVTVQLAAGREALGVATATISLSRAFGGAIGVAIVGATLFAQIDRSADGSSALIASGDRRRVRLHPRACPPARVRNSLRASMSSSASCSSSSRPSPQPGR